MGHGAWGMGHWFLTNDHAPLGRGIGCGVWGVGEQTALTTSGSQAPSFHSGLHWWGFQAPTNAVSLHPTPYTLPPIPFLLTND